MPVGSIPTRPAPTRFIVRWLSGSTSVAAVAARGDVPAGVRLRAVCSPQLNRARPKALLGLCWVIGARQVTHHADPPQHALAFQPAGGAVQLGARRLQSHRTRSAAHRRPSRRERPPGVHAGDGLRLAALFENPGETEQVGGDAGRTLHPTRARRQQWILVAVFDEAPEGVRAIIESATDEGEGEVSVRDGARSDSSNSAWQGLARAWEASPEQPTVNSISSSTSQARHQAWSSGQTRCGSCLKPAAAPYQASAGASLSSSTGPVNSSMARLGISTRGAGR